MLCCSLISMKLEVEKAQVLSQGGSGDEMKISYDWNETADLFTFLKNWSAFKSDIWILENTSDELFRSLEVQ